MSGLMKFCILSAFVTCLIATANADDARNSWKDALIGIRASSELIDSVGSYPAENLIDGSYRSWSEGSDGPGVGEFIEFEFDRSVELSTITVINGYGDVTLFEENGRVKSLAVSNESGERHILDLLDTCVPQRLSLPALTGTLFHFEILEVYPGSEWNDACLAELIPGKLDLEHFEFSEDFYYIALVPESYREGKERVADWNRAMTEYDSKRDFFDGATYHYDDFLEAYPQFASDFPEYNEMPWLDFKITETFDHKGRTYEVKPGGYCGDGGDPLLSRKSCLFTDDGGFLIVETDGILRFELNGRDVSLEDFIKLWTPEDALGGEVPDFADKSYRYGNEILSEDYYAQGRWTAESIYEGPALTIEYRWNGSRFEYVGARK